jgi:hypothetical protein
MARVYVADICRFSPESRRQCSDGCMPVDNILQCFRCGTSYPHSLLDMCIRMVAVSGVKRNNVINAGRWAPKRPGHVEPSAALLWPSLDVARMGVCNRRAIRKLCSWTLPWQWCCAPRLICSLVRFRVGRNSVGVTPSVVKSHLSMYHSLQQKMASCVKIYCVYALDVLSQSRAQSFTQRTYCLESS